MRIRWTEPAASDLTAICDYIEEHNGESIARRVAFSVYERVSGLEKFPEAGRLGRLAEPVNSFWPAYPSWRYTEFAMRP